MTPSHRRRARDPLILTFDLGSSATKAALWADDGSVATGRAEVASSHPRPGWAEQDPVLWWRSIVASIGEIREAIAGHGPEIEAISFSAARETFVPVAGDGTPIGTSILWSDQRAGEEASYLAAALGGMEALRRRTGVVIEAWSPVAKVAWIAKHEPERLTGARWLLAPRDAVVLNMTGAAVTDLTLASRTGFYDLERKPVPELSDLASDLLPPVVEPAGVAGELRRDPAAELGLRAGIPVVVGAGDRACEVLGVGATIGEPLVSWGSTANASAPVESLRGDPPPGLSVSAGATRGYVLEAGLSASGQALDWLSGLTGRTLAELLDQARETEPGARGVTALPWLNGARAPWWRSKARAAFLGLGAAHGPGDLARAVVEAVAFDVARGLEAISGGSDTEPGIAVRVAGGGAASELWIEVLTAVAGREAVVLRSGEAASVGACLLGASGIGKRLDRDRINPVSERRLPDPRLVEAYGSLRATSDAAASSVLGLGGSR